MGLFTRKPRDATANGETHRVEKRNARKHEKFDIDSGHLNRRPSFGQWYGPAHHQAANCANV